MIDNHHLLLGAWTGFVLLTIDYESWQINFVSESVINFLKQWMITDQLNKHNFIIYNEDEFVTGKLIDDELVLNTSRKFNFGWLYFPKLVGNQLIGLCNTEHVDDNGFKVWQLRKINLDTLTEETSKVPFALKDNSFEPKFPDVRLLT
jgi:hypothetical protein